MGYLDLGANGTVGGIGVDADVWRRAVDGNFGGTPNFVGDHAYGSGYFVLGDYGVDTTNDVVWAVVDYNAEFAAATPATVPEPATFIIWSLLGALGVSLDWWRRRKADF